MTHNETPSLLHFSSDVSERNGGVTNSDNGTLCLIVSVLLSQFSRALVYDKKMILKRKDKRSHCVPWEMTPQTRTRVPLSRFPALPHCIPSPRSWSQFATNPPVVLTSQWMLWNSDCGVLNLNDCFEAPLSSTASEQQTIKLFFFFNVIWTFLFKVVMNKQSKSTARLFTLLWN